VTLLISIAIVFPALAIWLVMLYRLDRNWRDKRSGHVIALMVLAGGLSVIPTAFAYEINPFWFTYWYGAFPFHFAVVGLTEELVKFLTFIVMTRVLKSIREPQDGVIQGAAVGVGFTIVENVMYGLWYGPSVTLMRSFLVAIHALAGAFWGFVWAGAVFENIEERQPQAYRLALVGFIPVAVLHGLYNTLTFVAVDSATVIFILYAFEAILLVVAMKGFRWMVQRSPYHRFPYADADFAMVVIRKGLLVNPGSFLLNRRLGIYSIAAGEYHEAIRRLDGCLRRAKGHPLVTVFLGIAVIGAGNDRHGTDLIETGAAALSEEQLITLERDLDELVQDKVMAELVHRILNPPLRSLDQWEARRASLGAPFVDSDPASGR